MIILECLRQHIAEYYATKKGSLVIDQAKVSSMVSDEEMSKFAKSNNCLNLMTAQENDKRYLISANWWREWCDYANFDLSQLMEINREFTEKEKQIE